MIPTGAKRKSNGSAISAAKKEAYARELLTGTTQSAAYRKVFPHSRNWKDATVHKRASELAGEVQGRLAELMAQAAEKVVLNRAWVTNNLMKHAEVCLGKNKIKVSFRPPNATQSIEVEMTKHDPAGANKALELLGKEIGMFVERRENANTVYHVSDEPMSEDEWAERFASGSPERGP